MLKKKRNTGARGSDPFLKELGAHCRKLRLQKGLSIDRMSKQIDTLSTSVIHRLENGSGAVTVTAVWRYAQALGLEIRELFDFKLNAAEGARVADALGAQPKLLSSDDMRIKHGAFKTWLPVYTAAAAAGVFGVGAEVAPKGWIEVKGSLKLDSSMFVVQVMGESMIPKIRSGDFLVFRASPSGTRQGKIVLAQYRGPADPDTGGSYTVKRYFSSKVVSSDSEWRHREIRLEPLNPEYEPITLSPEDANDFKIIGEYLFTVEID